LTPCAICNSDEIDQNRKNSRLEVSGLGPESAVCVPIPTKLLCGTISEILLSQKRHSEVKWQGPQENRGWNSTASDDRWITRIPGQIQLFYFCYITILHKLYYTACAVTNFLKIPIKVNYLVSVGDQPTFYRVFLPKQNSEGSVQTYSSITKISTNGLNSMWARFKVPSTWRIPAQRE
jgi:hypothetical protein